MAEAESNSGAFTTTIGLLSRRRERGLSTTKDIVASWREEIGLRLAHSAEDTVEDVARGAINFLEQHYVELGGILARADARDPLKTLRPLGHLQYLTIEIGILNSNARMSGRIG